jgi:hypothetical protein
MTEDDLQSQYDNLWQARRELTAKNRALGERILKLEETDGMYRDMCELNGKLVERIREMKQK